MDGAIVSTSAGALNAENYQTFEMAKANDDVLGSTDIGLLKAYAEVMRAAVSSAQMTMAAAKNLGVVSGVKQETAQLQAKVALYADTRIGELLSELPKSKGGRPKNLPDTSGEFSKRQTIKDAGISKGVAEDLQKLAAHPEVVEETIAKAEEEGKPVSRARTLKAIDKKKETEVSPKDEHGKQGKKPRRKPKDIVTEDGKFRCRRCNKPIEPGDEEPNHRTFHKECWKKRHVEICREWRERQHLEQNITIGDVDEVIEHDKAELKRQLLLDARGAWGNLQATITRYRSMGVTITEDETSGIRDAIEALATAIEAIEEG